MFDIELATNEVLYFDFVFCLFSYLNKYTKDKPRVSEYRTQQIHNVNYNLKIQFLCIENKVGDLTKFNL